MSLHDPTHKFEGEISPRTKKIATAISVVCQPVFVPIPVILLINTLIDDIGKYLLVSFLNILFLTLIPTFIVYYFALRSDKGNTDGDIPNREERYVPMILGTASYVLGIVTSYLLDAPLVNKVMMITYAVVTAVLLLITTRWKISIHAVGIMGPSMILAYTFWPWGMLYFLLLIPVVWSRYVLKKHTPAQLAAGAVSGVIITGIIMVLML